MAKVFSDEFCAWVDRLDEHNDLTMEQLILMNEAWEARGEFERVKRIEAASYVHPKECE